MYQLHSGEYPHDRARDELADDLHAFEVASKDAAGKAAIIGIDIEFLAKVVKAQADP